MQVEKFRERQCFEDERSHALALQVDLAWPTGN